MFRLVCYRRALEFVRMPVLVLGLGGVPSLYDPFPIGYRMREPPHLTLPEPDDPDGLPLPELSDRLAA